MIIRRRDSQGTMVFWGATVNMEVETKDSWCWPASLSESGKYGFIKKCMSLEIMPRDIEKATWHMHPHLSTCKYTHTCTWESMKLWRWNTASGMWLFFWSHDSDLWVSFIYLHSMCVAALLWVNEGPNEHIHMQEHTECLEPSEVTINICPRHGLTV